MVPESGPTSSGHRRTNSAIDAVAEDGRCTPSPIPQSPTLSRHSASMRPSSAHRSKHLSTPNKSVPLLHNLPPSAPSPPTPAPSPTPHQRVHSWQAELSDDGDYFLRETKSHFSLLGRAEREAVLTELLNLCDNQLLGFVHEFVSPKLRKDPFKNLPTELCLRVSNVVILHV